MVETSRSQAIALPLAKVSPIAWLTLIGGAMRLATLTSQGLWYDEVFTAWLAGLPFEKLIQATTGDVHPPLWYLLEYLVVNLLGSSAFSLRLISVVAGIALIPLGARLAERFGFDRQVQFTTAALLTFAPFTIYYSQEARFYALLMVLFTVATLAVLEGRGVWLTLTLALALWLHNISIMFLPGLYWLAVWQKRQNLTWSSALKLALPFGGAVLMWSPWVLFGLVQQMGAMSQNGFWVRPLNLGTPIYIAVSMVYSHDYLTIATTSIVVLLCLAALRQMWADRQGLAVLGCVVIPLGGLVIASVLWRPSLIPRVAAPAVPIFYVGLALGIRRHRLLAVPLALTFMLWGYGYFVSGALSRDSVSTIRQVIEQNYGDGDFGIYHADVSTFLTLAYHLPNYDQAVWPYANDLSQSLSDRTKVAMGIKQAEFSQICPSHKRWFLLVFSNPTTSAAERNFVNDLLARYPQARLLQSKQATLIDQRLYELRIRN